MATVEDYLNDPLTTEAERRLIEACRKGKPCKLGLLPDETDEAPTVRAEVIRCLALEATSLHEAGIWLIGARITGSLNLSFAKCRGRLALEKCRFAQRLMLEQAELGLLVLDGSHFPGLSAQGANLAGSMVLRHVRTTGTVDVNGAQISGQLNCVGATLKGDNSKALTGQGVRVAASVLLSDLMATGTVDVAGAQIGGQLACGGAMLNGKGAKALNAQRVRVTDSVVLRELTATGTVDVSGAQIGGQLDCEGATLNGNGGKALHAQGVRVTDTVFLHNLSATGTLDVNGAQIGGQLGCVSATLNGDGGDALNAQGVRVADGFYFREIKGISGLAILASAQVHELVDDSESWAKCDGFVLTGFSYDRISGNTSPKSFEHRKAWLEKGSHFDGEFFPQPYTQFAKVMRASGHLAEARKALMERDTILFREAEKANQKLLDDAWGGTDAQRGDCGRIWLRLQGLRLWAGLSRWVIGHGHKPELALFWALWAWGIGTIAYFWAYNAGLMVPNSDTILTSSDWAKAVEQVPHAPVAAWQQKGLWSSVHYESFMSAIYALDLFLPITDLGQEKAWRVSTATPAGAILRGISFVYQIAGWVIVSLGIAAVTGFVQRNDPE